MELTWLDSNSWLIDWGGLRCLIDPWLVGDLTFGNTPWLFSQRRRHTPPLPTSIDLILLSQGLPDHTHPPTLSAYHHQQPDLPVVCSPNCVQTLQQQGFSNITVLEHGKTTLIHDRLAITATIGAPIGPFTRENGYIISDQSSGESLYYEPHGYPDPRLSQLAPIRTAIIPIVDLKIPLLGTIINGQNSALTIAQTLQAKHLIPTALGGDLEFTGIITKALQVAGSPAQLQKQLTERQMDTIILEPRSWETFRLPC